MTGAAGSHCSVCGAPNPATGKFCGQCGTSLATGCPSCGAPVVAGQRFCNDCGSPLTVGAAAAEATPVVERRVCSVLFADLVGFTTLAESRDPEQVRELLSRYFELARTIITRFGGLVEKFIGDAVMAVWGTPVAIEGDAERAVRAALDLVAGVLELGGEIGVPALRLRAGVVTGEVAVTIGATGEGMVAGDAVNTAARVQSVAEPGSVYVDATTQLLATAAIDFTDAGQHTVKGKSEPLSLWRAGLVRSGVGGAQRVDGLEAPLIGRGAELRTIKELFHAAAQRRTPRLVLVSGAAGLGKSRLGWEFEKYVDGLADVALWHRGRCLSYGDGIAFWALAEIVRQRFAIAEDDPLDVAAAKLADLLPDLVPDATDRAYVGPRVARLLNVTYPGDEGTSFGRDELFAGWRLLFERLAARNPVILLIEDAQHADPALLDFIDHLLDWAKNAPIYVLAFARPELTESRPGWASGRNRTTLTLDPLDARSMDALLAALVADLPPSAVAAIAGQAQGNPLFAVETVRSLIDQDVVVPSEGVYRLIGDIGTLSVPTSLHAVLAARLDALDPALRLLVADAAVLGTTFALESLAAVSGQPMSTVETRVRELVQRGVLEIFADPLSPQRGAYNFSQNMLRQVSYDTLARRDRKTRHLAVAAHLRDSFAADGDEVSDVIARHYLDAVAAVPEDPDVTELRRMAIAALVRGAERDVRSGAPARAAETFARAAELTEQLAAAPDTSAANLWERAAGAADLAGEHEQVRRAAERCLAHYQGTTDPRAAARVQAVHGRALGLLGRHAAAREQLTAALEVLRTDPDRDTVIALRELAGLEIFAGTGRADALSDEVLTLGQALNVPNDLMATLLITRGIAYLFSYRNVQSVAVLEHAVRLAEGTGASDVHGRALGNLASALTLTDPVEAVRVARAAREHCRLRGARWALSVALSNLVFALLLTDDWDAAADAIAESMTGDGLADNDVAIATASALAALRGDTESASHMSTQLDSFRRSDDVQDRTMAVFTDAWIAEVSGRHTEALTHARAILEFIPALGLTYERVYWAWPLGVRAAFALGDLGAVQELLALVESHPVGHLPPVLRAERVLVRARLGAATGDPDADRAMAGAIDALRAVGSPFHLAHGLLDHAEFLISRSADATALVVEARAIGERLGVWPVIDRADALVRDRAGSPDHSGREASVSVGPSR